MYESCAGLWSLKVSDCAAWTQAWGSILAIVAAICVAAWQRAADRKREDDRDRRTALQQLNVVTELFDHAVVLTQQVPAEDAAFKSVQDFVVQFRGDKIEQLMLALDRIGPSHVPDGQALREALALRQLLSDYLRQCSSAQSNTGFVHATEEILRGPVRATRELEAQIRHVRDVMYKVRERLAG